MTHATKNGKLAFINDVDNGLACGCNCTQCGEPLVANNKGKIKEHHFVHAVDSDCNGESLKHYMVKAEIKERKYLNIPTCQGKIMEKRLYSLVNFVKVEVDKQIDDSKYIADLICTSSNGKQLVIEIVVTHELGKAKEQYLKYNKITTLLIDVNKWNHQTELLNTCLLYTSPSPRDRG